jgi:hexosaminidase
MVCAVGASGSTLNLVPWPAEVVAGEGSFAVGSGTRIVPGEPALAALAGVLADEFDSAFGLPLVVDAGAPAAGNIRLALNGTFVGEAQRLTVTADGVLVEAANVQALAAATVTLLQAVAVNEGQVSIPSLTVNDQPFVAYRGLMIDVARQPHSVATLKRIIQLCRLYKIRYLQLHLTDDQGFKFPSTAFPLLTTQNHSGPPYTLAELVELEQYSQVRGVTIIPEFEIPGHSAAMIRTMPDLFKIKDTLPYEHHATVNWAKPEVMAALDVLIGEVCAVFQATPYFHIGGDEADFTYAHQNEHFIQRFQELGYAAPFDSADTGQLFRRLLRTLDGLVTTKYGKQMLVWEGFHRDQSANPLEPVPKTIPVMAFENTYYPANHLAADGYPVINTAWNPLYVVNGIQCSPENIYGWNIYQFGRYQQDWNQVHWITVPAGSNVIGAQMCSWEQPENLEISSLRLRLPAMSERIWNPDAGRTYADFSARVAATDTLLSRLAGIDGFAPQVDISGNQSQALDTVVGAGNSARLVGNAKTHWASTTAASGVNLNGFELHIDNGGGNAQTYNGTLTGPGTLRLTGRGTADWSPDIRLGGTAANTPDGVTLSQGRVTLNKSPGVNALAGSITVAGGSSTKRITLEQSEQISDAATIDSSAGTGLFVLELNGFNETIGSLTIHSGHRVNTGAGGVLHVASLVVGGVTMPKGAYTAGSHAFVEGTGYIDVDRFGPPVIDGPPAAPAAPSPPDEEAGVHPAFEKSLGWAPSAGASSYDVFLWEAGGSKPGSPSATVSLSAYTLPADLLSLTSYHWQVSARNAIGTTDGPQWSFSTVARWELGGELPATLDSIIGAGNSGLLVGDARTHWQATTAVSDIDLNGFELTLHNGGGNAQSYNGAITGPGGIRIDGRWAADWSPDVRLGGTAANSPGNVVIQSGRVTLDKPPGIDALAGAITMSGLGSEKRIVLENHGQIHDTSTIDSTASGGFFELVLNGFHETVASLNLKAGHQVNTGPGGVLTVGALTVGGTLMAAGAYTAASHPSFVSGSGSVVVEEAGGGGFAAWAVSKGLTGTDAAFDADPDGDGIPNGIEFVIGGEPNPTHGNWNSRALLPVGLSDHDQFSFIYRLMNEAASLDPVVEFSAGLDADWVTAVDPGNASIVVAPGDPAATVTVTIPKTGRNSLFARLSVTSP